VNTAATANLGVSLTGYVAGALILTEVRVTEYTNHFVGLLNADMLDIRR